MLDEASLPLTDKNEVGALAEELPIAVDQQRFQELILGFPRSYLSNTPRLEIVKHYLLMESLGTQRSISSLYSAGEGHWKLVLVTLDRRALFAAVSGAVSCSGMDIRAAQAFANRASLGLGTFLFEDSERLFDKATEKEQFQTFLESVVEGDLSFDELFIKRWNRSETIPSPALHATMNNQTQPSATRLRFVGPDHFGLLFCLSRFLADQQCTIRLASISTADEQVRDDFYLTRNGSKLPEEEAAALELELEELVSRLLSREIGIEQMFGPRALAEPA